MPSFCPSSQKTDVHSVLSTEDRSLELRGSAGNQEGLTRTETPSAMSTRPAIGALELLPNTGRLALSLWETDLLCLYRQITEVMSDFFKRICQMQSYFFLIFFKESFCFNIEAASSSTLRLDLWLQGSNKIHSLSQMLAPPKYLMFVLFLSLSAEPHQPPTTQRNQCS